jgi:threonine dehydrogenase-like Zn-dependent dehydrogenase
MSKYFEYVYNSDSTKFNRKDFSENEVSLEANDVLVKPTYVGICGSDLYLMHSKLNNLRLGHEWVGEVTAVGINVTDLSVGSIVTGTGHFACGKCDYCLEQKTNLCTDSVHFSSDKMGALRSFFKAPRHQVFEIKSKMDSALALIEVMAVGEQAYEHLKDQLKNYKNLKVAVFGAGAIGIATATVLKSHGINAIIIEKNRERIAKAKSNNFTICSFDEMILTLQYQNYFNILIDCTNDYSGSSGAFQWLNHFSEKQYTALIVGKYVNYPKLATSYNSKSAHLIWMRGVSSVVFEKTIKLWTDKLQDLKKTFISHEYTHDTIDDAFKMADIKSESLKVIIKMN